MSDEITSEEEVQEEATPKKATRKKAVAKPAEKVVFRSQFEEAREFEVNGIRARRNAQFPGKCEWHVPAGETADNFEKHYHVQRGRIQRVS